MLGAGATTDDVAKRVKAREVAREFVTVGSVRYIQAALDEDSAQCVQDKMWRPESVSSAILWVPEFRSR